MPPTPFRSYIICTTPRSGSTFLCGLLKATGYAGRPDSLFHKPDLDRWLTYHGLAREDFASHEDALRAVLARAIEKGTGDTRIFGLRLQRPSFAYFMAQLSRLHPTCRTDIERIEAAFGPTLFIHLHRHDKLAQAISRTIAEQTGLWHRAADGSELERTAPPRDPIYDRTAIARHMRELGAMDTEWCDWFAREGLEPLRINYDDLSADRNRTLMQVVEALGLDPNVAKSVDMPTAKLADATNRDWIARFKAETPRT